MSTVNSGGAALAKETKRSLLGSVGYAIFAANAHWKGGATVPQIVSKAPVAELLPGGQFSRSWIEWLAKEELLPRVLARVSSFTDLARVVQAGHAAAVLPEMAAVDFDPKKFKWEKIDALKPRTMVLIANARSLDRSGIASGVEVMLSEALKVEPVLSKSFAMQAT